MKTKLVLSAFILALAVFFITSAMKEGSGSQGQSNSRTKVQNLGYESFRTNIFDFEKNKEWQYKGKNPAIIEFYADWCGPCKLTEPILDDLSVKYDGKVNIYKINIDRERKLSSMFGVRGVPTFIFIPVNKQPYMSSGMITRKGLVNQIETKLLTK